MKSVTKILAFITLINVAHADVALHFRSSMRGFIHLEGEEVVVQDCNNETIIKSRKECKRGKDDPQPRRFSKEGFKRLLIANLYNEEFFENPHRTFYPLNIEEMKEFLTNDISEVKKVIKVKLMEIIDEAMEGVDSSKIYYSLTSDPSIIGKIFFSSLWYKDTDFNIFSDRKHQVECGLTEDLYSDGAGNINVQERISDCSKTATDNKRISKNGIHWNLVTRKKDLKRNKYVSVWQDSKTGLLWGDTLSQEEDIWNKLVDSVPEAQKVCATTKTDPTARLSVAHIHNVNFTLPTVQEYEAAIANGYAELFMEPRTFDRTPFWTSTQVRFHPKQNWILRIGKDSSSQIKSHDHSAAYIKCVGREK